MCNYCTDGVNIMLTVLVTCPRDSQLAMYLTVMNSLFQTPSVTGKSLRVNLYVLEEQSFGTL